MRQLADISRERDTMSTMVELTEAFEGIASMRIAQVKDQTQRSAKFFAELWGIYNQIRVDELFHFGRGQSVANPINKELLILVTSEGSFSGDLDERLIKKALGYYKPDRNDIIVIGHHGAVQLVQSGVFYVRNFKMPERNNNINVTPIVKEVLNYASTKVYYQQYISLMDQIISELQLASAVMDRGKGIAKPDEIISEQNYIFEPSAYAVVDHLERSMMQITISEVILESKLAQYASRFRAMTVASDKANESLSDATVLFNQAKRHLKDERLKEVMNGLREGSL
ncbi:F0F1 ATP synthase subunit gamma [Candidatus Saccharibacteria bacterium]|nr:F0F1 ATP synthase subunit gamma [Candidatus Saccharibacteria bacterium]